MSLNQVFSNLADVGRRYRRLAIRYSRSHITDNRSLEMRQCGRGLIVVINLKVCVIYYYSTDPRLMTFGL